MLFEGPFGRYLHTGEECSLCLSPLADAPQETSGTLQICSSSTPCGGAASTSSSSTPPSSSPSGACPARCLSISHTHTHTHTHTRTYTRASENTSSTFLL